MAVDQENVSKIISVLSHRLRREILLLLSEKGECSFTDLLNVLDVDTGKLSFHIRSLAVFVEQTPTGKYRLSKTGENAVRVIRDVESWTEAADLKRKATHLPPRIIREQSLRFSHRFTSGHSHFGHIAHFAASLLFPRGKHLKHKSRSRILHNYSSSLGYSTLLEGFNGQSLGKRVMGLKVVKTDGKNLSYDHAAVRNFGKAFLLPFDLIVGWRLKNQIFLRYFDKFAGTTVITLRR